MEEISKIYLVEVSPALLSRRFSELLQSYLEPYLECLSLCVLDNCLQEREGFFEVHVVPEYPAYLLEVVNNTLSSENEFLDLLDRGVEFILHAGEVLSDEGVFVLSADCVEIVVFMLVLALEYVGEGVEALGFF